MAHIIRWISIAFVVLLAAGWLLFLRPIGLGGRTAYIVVTGTSMQPMLHTGDLAVVTRRAQYRRGEVITYKIPGGEPGAGDMVIHRIVGGSGSEAGFRTQGDNRDTADSWHPTNSDVVGALWFHIPHAGAVVAAAHRPPIAAALAGGLTVLLIGTGSQKPRRRGVRSPMRKEEAHA